MVAGRVLRPVPLRGCLPCGRPGRLHSVLGEVERFMLVPATGWIFLPTSLHLDRSWPHFLCRFETWLCMKVDRPCLVTRLICGRARSHETLIVPSVLSFEVPEVFLAVSLPIVIELSHHKRGGRYRGAQ